MIPTPTYEPSEEQIEALRGKLELSRWFPRDDYRYRLLAIWILFRYEPRTPKATPKGDECAHDWNAEGTSCVRCWAGRSNDRDDEPRCGCGHPVIHHSGLGCHASNCNCCIRRETLDGSHASDGVSEAAESRGNAAPSEVPDVPAAPVTKPAYNAEEWNRGYRAGRDAAARANVRQVEHVVELGPATLRALVAAILYSMNKGGCGVDDAVNATDTLLAHLKETKP